MKNFYSICSVLSRFFDLFSVIIVILLLGIDCQSPMFILKLALFGVLFFLLARLFNNPDSLMANILSVDFCFKALVGKITFGHFFKEYRRYLKRSRSLSCLYRKCKRTFYDSELRSMVMDKGFRCKLVGHSHVIML